MKIVSGGSFCLPAIMLNDAGLRKEAMPFDWLFCNVQSLIFILQSNFRFFLDFSAIDSITDKKTHASALNRHYDGGRKDRPFFNHKDPKKDIDRQYYERCIQRFLNLNFSETTLFVFEEFGEISSLYNDLCSTLDQHTPGLKAYAVRHHATNYQTSLEIEQSNNGHMLVNFSASNVVDGSRLNRKEDTIKLISHLTSSRI